MRPTNKTNWLWLGYAAVVALGLGLRWLGRDFESGDFKLHLSSWYFFLQHDGVFNALRHNFSNYPPTYHYMLGLMGWVFPDLKALYGVKIISVAFDLLLAFAITKIASLRVRQPWLLVAAFGCAWLAPTVILNSAVWGQADAIFSSIALLCVYCLLRERYTAALLWFGLALACKQQAIFLLPVLMHLLLGHKLFPMHLLVAVSVYVATYLPAFAAGKLPSTLVTLYSEQVKEFSMLQLNAPNVWGLLYPVPGANESMSMLGAVLTFASVLLLLWLLRQATKQRTSDEVVLLGAWAGAVLLPTFLPRMHDRYFFLADALALAAVFFFLGGPRRARWLVPIALLFHAGSVGVYGLGLFYWPIPLGLAALCTLMGGASLFIWLFNYTFPHQASSSALPNYTARLRAWLFTEFTTRRLALGLLIGLVIGAGVWISPRVRAKLDREQLSATFRSGRTRVHLFSARANRCATPQGSAVQLKLTWTEVRDFVGEGKVFVHLYNAAHQRVAIQDGVVNGSMAFNHPHLAKYDMAETRLFEFPETAQATEIRLGVYIEGQGRFEAWRQDGSRWESDEVRVLIRDDGLAPCAH